MFGVGAASSVSVIPQSDFGRSRLLGSTAPCIVRSILPYVLTSSRAELLWRYLSSQAKDDRVGLIV